MRSTDLPALLDALIPRTLELLRREFPNGIAHVLHTEADRDVRPRELHPAFYGCFDWHSAVHSCWQVVRAIRARPDAPFGDRAREVLGVLLSSEALNVELEYCRTRTSFERPYGLAWLLRLASELRATGGADAARWSLALGPLEELAAERLWAYAAVLPAPVRTGAHDQTAFSLGLALDWATSRADDARYSALAACCVELYEDDRCIPLAFEPSGADFLSPALAEADLMRRVFDPERFREWFDRFTGDGARQRLESALTPVTLSDPSDGKLAHFAGLNLSRAWMLRDIAAALGPDHALTRSMDELARHHAEAGIPLALHDDYMVSHWAPTFAVMLLTSGPGGMR